MVSNRSVNVRIAVAAVIVASGVAVPGVAQPAPQCVLEAPQITVAAKDIKFSKDCLATKANAAFTISFDNQEAQPHNVAILTTGGQVVFRGQIFKGPKGMVYQVPPIAPGTYIFQCDPHASTMKGQFTAG